MSEDQTTPESHLRRQYAQEIAITCPPTLYDEIALTGSSARGIATEASDLEINFWVKSLPAAEDRRAWLAKIGVQNILVQPQPRPDESYWIDGTYKGIELEAGWQTFDALDTALNQIVAGQILDHKALRLPELILSAKSLRGLGALDKWQYILQDYPEALAPRLIEDALSGWLTPDWLTKPYTADTIKSDCHRIWRLIFALNHQWEINWKYAHHSLPKLSIYPKNIIQRIWEIQHADEPQSQRLMLSLIGDTLQLIKINTIDTTALITTTQDYQKQLSDPN